MTFKTPQKWPRKPPSLLQQRDASQCQIAKYTISLEQNELQKIYADQIEANVEPINLKHLKCQKVVLKHAENGLEASILEPVDYLKSGKTKAKPKTVRNVNIYKSESD